MARLATRAPEIVPLSTAERRLAAWLRFFAVIFAGGAVIFFVRSEGTVADLDRIGLLLGLAPLPPTGGPVAANFWLTLAVANMATIAACAGLAATDVRRRRALVYPLVVSKLTSSGTGLLLFAGGIHAFPYLVVPLVDLPIAAVLVAGLRAARPLEP